MNFELLYPDRAYHEELPLTRRFLRFLLRPGSRIICRGTPPGCLLLSRKSYGIVRG